jgi:hypothetical protein
MMEGVDEGSKPSLSVAQTPGGTVAGWLAHLDAKAKTLQPATSWSNPYDCFMLARYPWLQPKSGLVPDTTFRVGELMFSKWIKKQDECISTDKKARRALRDLNDSQRRQLAALVYECTVQLEEHLVWADRLRNAVKLAKEAESFEKRLTRTKNGLLRAFPEFEKASSRVDELVGPQEVLSQVRQLSSSIQQIRTSHGVDYWAGIRRSILESKYYRMVALDPTSMGMAQIFALLHYDFGITKGEAEVRTALIRNALWSTRSTHVPKVKITSRYLHDQAIGCDAVRKAASRFRFLPH